MKNILIFIFILIPLFSFGQDPSLGAVTLFPDPPVESASGTSSVIFFNSGIDIPANSGLTMTITFINQEPTGPPSGTIADKFAWTYDNTFGAIYTGVQVDLITDGEGGLITVPIFVTGAFGSLTGISVNLQVPGDFVGNTEPNDAAYLTKTITENLPVVLTSFSIYSNDCEKSIISWQTASEINNAGFDIERSIGHIRDFEKVGFVEGANNSTEFLDYTFNDDISNVSWNSEIYYRLKQVDLDERYEYSDIIVLKSDCLTRTTASVYPNPVVSELNVDFVGDMNSVQDITITNSLNQTVFKLSDVTDSRMSIDMMEYISGVYYINIVDISGESILSKKIINLGR
ncbi:MAG: hypothetical protein ACI9P5_002634 [Saprospiraceae bacterium]|jgi:hypothetical protein